jgi:ubiquinone/menaquinone biosynthesis C-methylase UbiE
MNETLDSRRQGSLAQQVFGPQAAVYATSQVHVSDESLEAIKRLALPGQYRWTLDLGTGAGFTAFAMTQCSRKVLAADPTRPMLQQTRRIGQERRLTNLLLSQNVAEALPIASGSLDLVTCRVAAHHFSDLEKALDEVGRVLKKGGALVMADSVAPEDDAVARWMNDVELRRDFSHVRNRPVSELEAMLSERGMDIVQQERTRIYLQFNDWVARTATPPAEVDTLRQDFLSAPQAVQEAFQIEPLDGDIHFSWPCLIFQAIKK